MNASVNDSDFWLHVDTCNYCKKNVFKEYMVSSIPSWYQGKDIVLKECCNCGLVFADPRPNPKIIYKGYLEGDEHAAAATSRKLNRPNVADGHLRQVQEAISHFVGTPTSLFDMGCGAGTVLEAANKLGLVAEGNDINFHAIKRLVALGFNCFHGFTHEINFVKKYDIVINFDYLEHSFFPFDDLKKCHDILNDNGILYLKTLYLDCPDHILKDDRYQLFGSGHFHYFKPRQLCRMVEAAGFEILNLRMGGLIFITAKKVNHI